MPVKPGLAALLAAFAILLATPSAAVDEGGAEGAGLSSAESPSSGMDSAVATPEISETAADWARGQIERYEPEQEAISQTITQTAVWLDSFFKTDRGVEEENTTRLRLGYEVSFEDGSGFGSALNTDLRLILPSIERRWGLFVNSMGEDLKPLDSELTANRGSASPVATEKGFTTGLRYIISQTQALHARAEGGMRFHGIRPEFYGGIRFRQSWPSDFVETSFTQRITWYQETGFEAGATVDFDRKVTDTSMIRFSPQVSVYSRVDMPGLYYGAPVNYFVQISGNDAIDCEAFIWLSSSPDNHIDDQGARVVYRRRIYKSWVFGESAVWARFPKERAYQQTPGVLFKLDVYFGHTREFAAKKEPAK